MEKFYLGVSQEGYKVYLEKPSWDCGWYWGFGYVREYKRGKIESHNHFDSMFLSSHIFDSYKGFFKESNLNDEKIWLLLSYMKEFYTMRKYAELLQYGGYISAGAVSILEEKNKEANKKEVERINKTLLPELFEKIEKLFA